MPQAHRYWRLANMRGVNGATVMAISAIVPFRKDSFGDVFDVVKSFEIGSATIVTASGNANATIAASVGVEAYQSTTFNQGDTPLDPVAPWVKFDFTDNPVAISSIDFTALGGEVSQIDTFELQWSDDGETWVTQCYRYLGNAALPAGSAYSVPVVDYSVSGTVTLDGAPAASFSIWGLNGYNELVLPTTIGTGTYEFLVQDASPMIIIAIGAMNDAAKAHWNVVPIEKVYS